MRTDFSGPLPRRLKTPDNSCASRDQDFGADENINTLVDLEARVLCPGGENTKECSSCSRLTIKQFFLSRSPSGPIHLPNHLANAISTSRAIRYSLSGG